MNLLDDLKQRVLTPVQVSSFLILVDIDHSSWKRAGYRSAFAMETEFHSSNPDIHTSRDDISNVDVTWMAEFAKMGIGMAGELASADA